MAFGIAYTNGGSGIGAGPPVTFTTWTIPTCNKLLAFIGMGDETDRVPVSVSWNGVAMTHVTSIDDANWVGCAVYYLDNPDVGNYTLTINLTGANDAAQIGACIVALTDAETGAPAYNAATATSTAPSVTVAGSANGDLLIGAVMTDAQATATETDTLIYEAVDIANDTDFNVQYATATGASAVSDWSTGSAAYAAVAVAVGAAAGGGVTITPSIGTVAYTGNSSPMDYRFTPKVA